MKSFSQVHSHLRSKRLVSLEDSDHDPTRTPSHSPAAVYGFAMWFASMVLFVAWIAWAFLPHHWLPFGDVLPSPYWALALPTWFCVTLLTGAIMYRLMCIYTNPSPSETLHYVPPPHADHPSHKSRIPVLSDVRPY